MINMVYPTIYVYIFIYLCIYLFIYLFIYVLRLLVFLKQTVRIIQNNTDWIRIWLKHGAFHKLRLRISNDRVKLQAHKQSLYKILECLRMVVPAAHSCVPVIDYRPRSCRNGNPSLMVRDIKSRNPFIIRMKW
jgi:hypothetical protein